MRSKFPGHVNVKVVNRCAVLPQALETVSTVVIWTPRATFLSKFGKFGMMVSRVRTEVEVRVSSTANLVSLGANLNDAYQP